MPTIEQNIRSNVDAKIPIRVGKLAEIFEKAERTIQNWVEQKGAPGSDDNGIYDLLLFMAWRIDYLMNEISEFGTDGDKKLNELRRDGERLKNIERSVKIQKIASELLEYEPTMKAWLNEVTIFRTNMNGFIHTLNTELEGTKNNAERLPIIRKCVNDVLSKISELNVNMDEFDLEELQELENSMAENDSE